jgi:hypothetical protein
MPAAALFAARCSRPGRQESGDTDCFDQFNSSFQARDFSAPHLSVLRAWKSREALRAKQALNAVLRAFPARV